jgi:hypothetical protein
VTIDPKGKGLVYDRAYSRWLPVPRNAVAPDGRHYVYRESDDPSFPAARIHMVNVIDGADRVFTLPAPSLPGLYVVLDYAGEGVYLTSGWEGPLAGVWVLNPTTGSLLQRSSVIDVQARAGEGEVWVGAVNQQDPNSLQGYGQQANEIRSLDLATGEPTTWFYRPASLVTVVGSDIRGRPVLSVFGGKDRAVSEDLPAELLLLTGINSAETIYRGSAQMVGQLAGDRYHFKRTPLGDSHGIWFGSDRGIYFFTEMGGLRKVSNQPGSPAGFCA